MDPYTDFQQWNPTVKKWTRGGAPAISKDFDKWLSTSTTKYDRTCELFDEIKGDERKQLEVDYARKVGSVGHGKTGTTKEGPWHTFGRVKSGTSFAMMEIKQEGQVLFAPTNLKLDSSYTGATKTKKLVGTALYMEVDVGALASNLTGNFAATCDVILRREPAELYGQIFSIQASLLQSISAGECKNVLVSERKKAPSKMSASFIRDPGAGGEVMAEGTKDKPLEVTAGQALPVVAVRAINGEGKEIVDWLRQSGKVGPLRFNQSVLHGQGGRQGQAAEGYKDTPHTSGFGRIGETDNKVTLSP